MDKSIIFLLIALVIIFIVNKVLSKFKSPAIGALTLVNGGVKSGKTTYSVNLAYREYKSRLRAYKFRKFICKLLFINYKGEEPLLYSNIPLNMKGVKVRQITPELLTRQERFAYGSVVYLSEFSLVADSTLVKDKILNERLLEFFKLFGHETKGGVCIVDTQSISDCHFSLKRCLDRHIYIYKCIKWIPFFLLLFVREERYAEDGTVVNSYNEDVEESLQKVIIPKRVWKMFDCYTYSAMTDDNDVSSVAYVGKSLKSKDYVSFKKIGR